MRILKLGIKPITPDRAKYWEGLLAVCVECRSELEFEAKDFATCSRSGGVYVSSACPVCNNAVKFYKSSNPVCSKPFKGTGQRG